MAGGPNPALDVGKADLLGRYRPFEGLAPATLQALAAAGRGRSWGAGGLVFQRGDPGDDMLAITAGRIRLSFGTAQGRELVLRMLGPWEVVGELAILDGQPRSADAVAVEPTTAIVLGRRAVLAVAEERPDLGLALARHLCAMVRATNEQMESIALHDLRTRLVRFLLHALRQAHGARVPDQATLELGFSQSDLSAILGASRPKVNQALQALLAEGALQRDGGRLLCRVPLLRRIVGADDLAGAP